MKFAEAIILLYHGVTTQVSFGIENFSGKHLPLERFEKQMAYLKTHANVVSLRELSQFINSEQDIPPNTVAITFDDTYLNVFEHAIPILKHYKLPATFFITTGFIGTTRLYWTDKLEYLINYTNQKSISLNINHEELLFNLARSEDKKNAILTLKSVMKKSTPLERSRILDAVEECIGPIENYPIPKNYSHMTWEQLQEINDCQLFEIGGHTVNHEILSRLQLDELIYEIEGCLNTISAKLGLRTDLFAYPEGQEHDYNDMVINILQSRGVSICPSASFGTNTKYTNLFKLNRIMVGFMGQPFPFISL